LEYNINEHRCTGRLPSFREPAGRARVPHRRGLISSPYLAFAQDGDGGNPFADATARSGATAILTSMRFWVWIAAGLGFCTYLLAYFAQGIVPSFFQQYRDYLRNGALLMVAFGVVIQFIIGQAGS
jgi:hypothetical protein